MATDIFSMFTRNLTCGGHGCFSNILTTLPFSDLLTPHGIIQALLITQTVMCSGFYYFTFFQNINPVGMHNGRQAMCYKYGYLISLGRYMPDGFCYFFFS